MMSKFGSILPDGLSPGISKDSLSAHVETNTKYIFPDDYVDAVKSKLPARKRALVEGMGIRSEDIERLTNEIVGERQRVESGVK